MKYQIIILFIVTGAVLYSNQAKAQTQTQKERTFNSQEDEEVCYAQILTEDKYKSAIREFPIFTGNDVDREGVEPIHIVLEKERFKWVKIETDSSNCPATKKVSSLWCRKRIPEKFESKYIVSDTQSIKNFVVEKFEERVLVKEGELLWRKFTCNQEIPNLYEKVQQALLDRGYYIGKAGVDGIIARDTKNAIVKFQKDNDLPTGNLDLETLEALGIRPE